LKPVRVAVGLLGGEHFDKAVRESAEAIRARDVAVERRGVELREDEDADDVRVDAVADGDVDESVLAAERDGGFRTQFSQWEEAGTLTAAENDRQRVSVRTGLSAHGASTEGSGEWAAV
jgi:hypothetical protein